MIDYCDFIAEMKSQSELQDPTGDRAAQNLTGDAAVQAKWCLCVSVN